LSTMSFSPVRATPVSLRRGRRTPSQPTGRAVTWGRLRLLGNGGSVARGEHGRLTLAAVAVVAALVGCAGFALSAGGSEAAPAAAFHHTTPLPTAAPTPAP